LKGEFPLEKVGMKSDFKGARFSVPYEIAAVRPLRQTTLEEREKALKAAYYNTELISQEMVYVDLKTDSGVSALSVSQANDVAGRGALEAHPEMTPEAHAGLASLSKQFQQIFGFPYVVPVTQGRAAERIWTKIHMREGAVVPGNMLFPSTRFHIESNGGKVIDVISDKAYDLFSEDPFKGNLDLKKLRKLLKEHGPQRIPCVYVELCVNSSGGHPVSMGNLREIKRMIEPQGIPLFLDASRILENSYFIQGREKAYESRSIAEIVREICSYADGCTLSALKDFPVREGGFIATRDEKSFHKAYFQSFLDGAQPFSSALESLSIALREIFQGDRYVASRVKQTQYLWRNLAEKGIAVLRPEAGHAVFIDVKSLLPEIPSEHHPAEALAAFIYSVSGVRITKGPPLTREQTARGIELLRLALPARRYLQGHLDDVAEAVLCALAHRDEIKGLRQIEKPGRSKYEPPLFVPIGK